MKKILRNFYYSISPAKRLLLRKIAFAPIDLWEAITGKNKKLIPPKGLIFVGSGDFQEQGERFLEYFQKHGGLKPHHRVLDIGCGIGRMAVPLTNFLSPEGSYEGFDIVKDGIDWCLKNITPQSPHFRFTHIELKNHLYSSKGKEAGNFRFPYEKEEFDFVFLTSVFTHMIPAEVENYLAEIFRVLKGNGRCLSTFFILDETSKISMSGDFNFPYDYGFYRLMDKRVQSANVAYGKEYLLKQFGKNKLVVEKLLPGRWSGRNENEGADFQDIVVLAKNHP